MIFKEIYDYESDCEHSNYTVAQQHRCGEDRGRPF